MITVTVPQQKGFDYKGCEKLYNSCKDKLRDASFASITSNPYFFCFHFKSTLIGCIYFYKRGKRLFVNAFAGRKHHLLNIECVKESLTWWDCDIYAEATEPTSRLVVLRCGFKRIKGNIFRYRRQK